MCQIIIESFFFRKLGEAIQAICRHVVKNHRDIHDWLFAVPLVHFLTQVSQPFNSSVLLTEKPENKDETWWGASGFDTKTVRERTFFEDRYFNHFVIEEEIVSACHCSFIHAD